MVVIDGLPSLKLYEFRWDGSQKHVSELESHQAHLWSSVTLYSKDVRAKRENMFFNFIGNERLITKEVVYDFHSKKYHLSCSNNNVKQYNNGLQTVSISQIEMKDDFFEMTYRDVKSQRLTVVTKKIKKSLYE